MIIKCIFFYIFLIFLSTSANSVDLKSNIEAKVISEKTKISNNISNKIVEKISAKISESENIK